MEREPYRQLAHVLGAVVAGCLPVITAGATAIPTQPEFEAIIYDGDLQDTSNIISSTGEWHFAEEPWAFRDPAEGGNGAGIHLSEGGTLTFNLQNLSTQDYDHFEIQFKNMAYLRAVIEVGDFKVEYNNGVSCGEVDLCRQLGHGEPWEEKGRALQRDFVRLDKPYVAGDAYQKLVIHADLSPIFVHSVKLRNSIPIPAVGPGVFDETHFIGAPESAVLYNKLDKVVAGQIACLDNWNWSHGPFLDQPHSIDVNMDDDSVGMVHHGRIYHGLYVCNDSYCGGQRYGNKITLANAGLALAHELMHAHGYDHGDCAMDACGDNNFDCVDRDLAGATLDNTVANYAGLHSIDFRGTSLKYAEFFHSNLSQSDFREANLCGANLSQAYIIDAKFDEADLRHADLRWPRALEGTTFLGARYCPETTLLPDGFDPDAFLMQVDCTPCEVDPALPNAPSGLTVF